MTIRIALTGGGTGGHLYPLLAVADELKYAAGPNLRLSYFGPRNEMTEEFEMRDIAIYPIAPSKLRRYFDIRNIIDIPKFFFGIIQALFKLYSEMPNVIFSKGGPGALPVIIAAKWYMIPIVIHESDSVPSLTTRLSAKFAKKILVSFKETTAYFPPSKTIVVGNPIRREFIDGYGDTAQLKQFTNLNPNLPNILVLGGSQGSVRINTFILDSLRSFLPEMQITHQVGTANFDEMQALIKPSLKELDGPLQARYHQFAYLTPQRLKESLGAADIIISRAGAGTIFEIAAAQKPAILIPLDGSANDHQRSNAYVYAGTGAATVVEESNLTTNLVLSLIHSMLKDENMQMRAKIAAKNFFKPAAAKNTAEEILQLVKGFSR